jgi:hypothetical protein
MNMLVAVPDLRQEMVSNGAYFAIIGRNEMQTTLPECSHMDSEYWAGGVQSYFNANAQSLRGDGVHNCANAREELAEYDPVLDEFISRIFNGLRWTPTCPNEE